MGYGILAGITWALETVIIGGLPRAFCKYFYP